MSTPPPWSPPTARRPNYDQIRARLNEALEAERYEEAEAIAVWLRERLLRESMLDQRLRKSLSGADKVLHRLRSLKEQRAPRRPRLTAARWLFLAGLAAMILGAGFLYLQRHPAGATIEASLQHLLDIDRAVLQGLNLPDYQRALAALPAAPPRGPATDVALPVRALMEARACYETALVEWQTAVARGLAASAQPASLRDSSQRLPWVSRWRSAHALLALAGSTASPRPLAPPSSATAEGRLVGDWSSEYGEVRLGEVDAVSHSSFLVQTVPPAPVLGTYEVTASRSDELSVVVHLPSRGPGRSTTFRLSADGDTFADLGGGTTWRRRK